MNTTRREFFERTLLIGMVLPILKACQKTQTAPQAPSVNMISEESPTAKALKYVSNASNADPKIKVEKLGTAPKDQNCENCLFYKSSTASYGVCQILQPGFVSNVGWCVSWSLKA